MSPTTCAVSDNSTFLARVWQWIKDDGGIFRRTIIDERRVSENWRDYADDLEGL